MYSSSEHIEDMLWRLKSILEDGYKCSLCLTIYEGVAAVITMIVLCADHYCTHFIIICVWFRYTLMLCCSLILLFSEISSQESLLTATAT
jgi:hypothetical protein